MKKKKQKYYDSGSIWFGIVIGVVLTSFLVLLLFGLESNLNNNVCHNETIVVGKELIKTYNHTCNLTLVYENNGFSKKDCIDLLEMKGDFQCKTDYCILDIIQGGRVHIRKENFTKEIEVWNPIKIEKEVCQ